MDIILKWLKKNHFVWETSKSVDGRNIIFISLLDSEKSYSAFLKYLDRRKIAYIWSFEAYYTYMKLIFNN